MNNSLLCSPREFVLTSCFDDLEGFEEAMGGLGSRLSSKQSVQSCRLTRVRRTDPKTATVSVVANAWGHWHIGQFARDFRKMFGELPPETLSRR